MLSYFVEIDGFEPTTLCLQSISSKKFASSKSETYRQIEKYLHSILQTNTLFYYL